MAFEQDAPIDQEILGACTDLHPLPPRGDDRTRPLPEARWVQSWLPWFRTTCTQVNLWFRPFSFTAQWLWGSMFICRKESEMERIECINLFKGAQAQGNQREHFRSLHSTSAY